MRKEPFLLKLWNVIWPPAIGTIAQLLITIIGMMVLESMSLEFSMIFLLISSLLCIPIYLAMYRKDKKLAGEEKRKLPMTNKDVFAIVIAGAAIALAGNNILSLTPLPQMFSGHEEVNETLTSGGIVLQLLVAGIFGPIEEELGMRGISYMRMKRYWGKRTAMIFSAFVFGVYHMNVVQGVYAFALGIFFAWVYDRYESLWAAIIAHMSANIFVVLLSENSIINNIFSTMVGFCLATCISVLLFYYCIRFMKQTDPRVELQFVEKEPDTLEKLIEEYKEHENR